MEGGETNIRAIVPARLKHRENNIITPCIINCLADLQLFLVHF